MSIYRWSEKDRKVKGNDWNALADLAEGLEGIEQVNSLPPCTPDKYGKTYYLIPEKRLYICTPP